MNERKTKNRNHSKKPSFPQALKKSALAFWAMAPMLIGVIGLAGLLGVLLTPGILNRLFRGNALIDTLIGTLAGAAAPGNPVVSYLLGGELLKQGISLYAVSAFILSWVTLGFINLPAEIEALGSSFTLRRNVLAFVFTMIIAVLTSLTVRALS